MGKTRDLFKKIRATKGTFQAKVGSIKDKIGRASCRERVEWERQEISSRKLEIPRENFIQRWAQ